MQCTLGFLGLVTPVHIGLTWSQIHVASFSPTLWSVVGVAGGWGMQVQGHIMNFTVAASPSKPNYIANTMIKKCSVSQLSEESHATNNRYLFTVTVLIWAERLEVTSALCHDTTTTDNIQ